METDKLIEDKLLRIANLSPDIDLLDRIEQVHPMKQVAIMSVVQVAVFGFMLLSFWIIDIGLSNI